MAYNLEDGTPSFVIEVDFLKGEKGDTGFSPRIEIASLTSAEYILKVINQDGEFLTPNLKSDLSLDDYVLKEEGKGLSTNSFENEEKQKLQELHNYDDTELKSQVSSLTEAIGNINSFDIKVVDELPIENIDVHTIYFVPNEQEDKNYYDEFLYVNSKWEHIGTSKVDLSNYATLQQVEELSQAQQELIDDLGKTYTGTNITAPTVAGYGRINKLYGQTIEDVNIYNETSNLQTTTQYAALSQGIISLIAGEKYTISFDTNNNGGTVYTDEVIFTSSITVTCDGKRKTVTLTAKNTITNSITTLIKASVATSTAYKIKNIKVQKGSVATPYSPYGYARVEVISENGENKSSNICYVKDGLNEDDYVDYTLGKVVRADGKTEDVLNCSNKIVQYADSTNVYNTDGAEMEVNLTNSEAISELNEQNKILEEKQRQMSNYSTKEQVVGTWINGKPLYRKFYQVTSPIVSTNGTYVYANYSVADLNTDFAFINNSWLDDSEFVFTLPYIKSSNGIVKVYFDIKNKEIELASNESTYNNKPCIVELLYTKTTD